MSNFQTYRILTSEEEEGDKALCQIAKMVRKLIARGYQPIGGISVVPLYEAGHIQTFLVVQAMGHTNLITDEAFNKDVADAMLAEIEAEIS